MNANLIITFILPIQLVALLPTASLRKIIKLFTFHCSTTDRFNENATRCVELWKTSIQATPEDSNTNTHTFR